MSKSEKSAEPKKVFIRTVTHYFLGELVNQTPSEMVLRNAAWIADTGRYAQFLSGESVNEVEPYPDGVEVHVNAGAIVDWIEWPHALLRLQK